MRFTTPRRRSRSALATIAATAVLATTTVITATAPPVAAAEPATVLVPERIIGGTGHAELYGWGATTMRDGTVLIGDYWNKRVLRFATDGTLIGTFIEDPGYLDKRHQAPYGLAVDPDNGDVYMADTDRRQVDRYSEDGTYLNSLGLNGSYGSGPGQLKYPSRVAIMDGYVYISDTFQSQIVVYTPTGTVEEFRFGGSGTAPGRFRAPRAIQFDSSGRLHVLDHGNKRIQVFTPDPANGTLLYEFSYGGEFDPSDPAPAPDDVFRGDLRGLAIDQTTDRVFAVDAEGSKVHIFTQDGTYLSSFGSNGTGPGQFSDGGREITVDGAGNLWVGDMPNFRVQVFDPTGTYIRHYPDPVIPPPLGGFNGPRGVAVDDAGNLFVSDTYNQRIQKLANDGSPITAWGSRGRDDYEFNYARLLAVDPNDQSVAVVDTDNHRVKKFDNDGLFMWESGTGGAGDGEFRNPHGIHIGADGKIYVADSNNARVQVLDSDGTFLFKFGVDGTAPGEMKRPRGVTVDDATGYIYVADATRDVVQEYDAAGVYLRTIATGLENPFDVETDGTFVIVADSAANQIKIWRLADAGYVGAFGEHGDALDEFNTPMGLALTDAGSLYIAERENERLTEWRLDTDTEDPLASIDPVGNPPTGPITFTGTATDDVAVDTVQLALQNDAGEWLQNDGTWAAERMLLDTELSEAFAETATWSFSTHLVADGSHTLEIVVTDVADRVIDPAATTSFAVVSDAAAPDTTMTSPTNNEVGTAPFVIEGSAVDDVAVADVLVSIKDRVTGDWWDPATQTWGPFLRAPAVLSAPGAMATDWTFSFEEQVNPGSGSYWVTARAEDTATKVDASTPSARFSLGAADAEDPETTLTSPEINEVVIGTTVEITGSATDDVDVAAVEVSVKDRVTELWWDPNTSTWGDFGRYPATLTAPGAPSTDWSFTFAEGDDPGSGDYYVLARAVDGVTKRDASPADTKFLVSADPVDTVAPDTALTAPGYDETLTTAPISIEGTATDDVALDRVEVAIKDRTTGLWWDPTTSTWGSFARYDAVLADPGAASSGWTFLFDAAADPGSGSYFASARAVDAAGNTDGSVASTRFALDAAGTDTTDPESTITTPTKGQKFTSRPVELEGTATDDVELNYVRVTVRDRNTDLWWNFATSTWQAGFVGVDLPTGAVTEAVWSATFDDASNPGSGDYSLQARAVDASNNRDRSVAVAAFDIDEV